MATRKAAKKKAAGRRASKKRAAKPARRAAKKRVTKKRPARRAAKPARKTAPKRAAKKRPARRAAKRLVTAVRKSAKPRPARVARRAGRPGPAASPAFAPQKAGATAKDLFLFELERARVAVLAAIQGIGAGTATRPMGEGRWSIHELVLHLAVRDRVRVEEFDSLLAGHAASWTNVSPGAEQAAENEAHLVPLRGMSWDEAVRMLMTTRAALLERLQAVPSEPAGVWSASHPFGATMRRLPDHDRGHAEAIKKARIAG